MVIFLNCGQRVQVGLVGTLGGGRREYTRPMTLEAALTAPVTGQHILSWLYAHEQVLFFNCSWELRETFLLDIYEIKGMLHAWQWHESERRCLLDLYEELTRNPIFDFGFQY